jgi:hypothetical protein
LAELNIPTVSGKMINSRLKEAGQAVQRVAKDSTDEALKEEATATASKKYEMYIKLYMYHD